MKFADAVGWLRGDARCCPMPGASVLISSCRTRSGIHREVGARPLGGSRNKSGVTM